MKLRALWPAFGADGVTTAGNASSINDGAAALVLMDAATARDRGLRPLVRIAGFATHSREPQWFTLAPIDAIRKLLDRLDWTVATTDLFEINKAFAAVAFAAELELAIPPAKLNPRGGAVALGHPIGASGARVLVSLIHALRQSGLSRGIAFLCIGGGEAVEVEEEGEGARRKGQGIALHRIVKSPPSHRRSRWVRLSPWLGSWARHESSAKPK